jgi:hypothetical protein
MDCAASGEPDLQRNTALLAGFLLPGKDDTRHAGHLDLEEFGGFLPLLLQDLVDG